MNANGKKSDSPYEIISTQKRNDFTLAMVTYNPRHSTELWVPPTE